MLKVGNKIRKIREIKNITPKDMADRLNLTPAGYNKIERDESGVNIERLMEIAGIFQMKVEDVISFDEKVVFNHIHGTNYQNTYNFPEDIKRLYDENAKLQDDKIKLQQEMIEMLKERLKAFEGK